MAPDGAPEALLRLDPASPETLTGVRWRAWILATMGAVALAHLADPLAWRLLRLDRVNDTDWGRLLRSAGYLPTWGLAAILIWRHRPESATQRVAARYVVVSALAGGVVAELLKLLFRRGRPEAELFAYSFRAFTEAPLSTRGLGLPSSHTLVAFAAATAMGVLFPRTRWAWFAFAAGCALTRVLALGHFLSDVTLAACLGWGIAHWVALRMHVEPVS